MNLQQQQPLPQRTTSSGRNEFLQNYVDHKGRGGSSLFSNDRKNRLKTLRDTAEYDPISKGYNLNPFQSGFLGITNQDVFNAKRNAEVEAINARYGGTYKRLGLGDNIPGNLDLAAVTNDINKALVYEKESPELKQKLAEVGGGYGTAALQELGRKPSILEMQSALRKARQSWEADPANETSALNIVRDAKQKQITATEAQILEATRANTLAQQTLTGQQEGQRFQRQLAAENARNRWEDKRQNRAENALSRQMNAENNAMQMQLEYSRLAQSDRQYATDRKDQAIMALLGGLGNLNVAFTV